MSIYLTRIQSLENWYKWQPYSPPSKITLSCIKIILILTKQNLHKLAHIWQRFDATNSLDMPLIIWCYCSLACSFLILAGLRAMLDAATELFPCCWLLRPIVETWTDTNSINMPNKRPYNNVIFIFKSFLWNIVWWNNYTE